MKLARLVAYLSVALVLALSVAGAAYADNDCHNDTTGPDSNNECEIEVENDADFDIDNDADFDADLDLDFDTGHNDVEKNTTAGDNKSGSVDVDVEGEVNIDQNAGGLCDCLEGWESGDNNASNQNTGPYSNNETEIKVENKLDVDVDNDADVDLDVDVDADTGQNDTEMNTTAGDTESGDVNFSFKWTTTINQSL